MISEARTHRWTSLLTLGVLIAIFSFSAIDKIFHFKGFLLALENYVILPSGNSLTIGVAVIVAELLIAIGLAIPRWRRRAALLCAVMLGLFLMAIGSNYIYGDAGICGCWFTITLAKGAKAHLILNGALLLMALSLWWDELTKVRAVLDSSEAPLEPMAEPS
ncbi:MAG: MauE/DoxX family redox-associated membrane protein [Acidobacteriota bacterium]